MLKLSLAATRYYPVSYLDVRKDVHVLEAVESDEWQVVGALAQVVQGVFELVSVRRQEVDAICGRWNTRGHTEATAASC